MNHPQGVISQVSADQQIGGAQLVNNYNEQEYYDDNTLIHLNIQGKHYYITRDQLMSLPESLLLCLFPSGVFVDREGQVITNLTPEDEVFIANFPPDCFESIMETYSTAENDLENFPVDEIFDRRPEQQLSSPQKGFFGFSSAHTYQPSESDILHQKPAIIVLREDLDYYCIPAVQLSLEGETKEENDTLMEQLMTQIKKAAGSHLCQQKSVFQGLYSSNRMKKPQNGKHSTSNLLQLGPAEQHLMDMLCSSGFREDSNWGNRSQEPGKTVISSLTLCRLMNETVQEFRDKVEEAKRRYEEKERLANQKQHQNSNPTQSGMGNTSTQSSAAQLPHTNSGPSDSKRRSRLSSFAGNVHSRSNSRTRSNQQPANPRVPTLYELVEKPEINTKLLLFWKKPARKCWWGMENINVDIRINGRSDPSSGNLVLSASAPQTNVSIPVTLHIRRVWTLELSVVGMQ